MAGLGPARWGWFAGAGGPWRAALGRCACPPLPAPRHACKPPCADRTACLPPAQVRYFILLLLLILTGFGICFNILLTSNSLNKQDLQNNFGTFDSTLLQLVTLMLGGVDFDAFNAVRLQPGALRCLLQTTCASASAPDWRAPQPRCRVHSGLPRCPHRALDPARCCWRKSNKQSISPSPFPTFQMSSWRAWRWCCWSPTRVRAHHCHCATARLALRRSASRVHRRRSVHGAQMASPPRSRAAGSAESRQLCTPPLTTVRVRLSDRIGA